MELEERPSLYADIVVSIPDDRHRLDRVRAVAGVQLAAAVAEVERDTKLAALDLTPVPELPPVTCA